MTKEEKYNTIIQEARELVCGEDDMVAKMSTLSALIHGEMGFWWTGFYIVHGDTLVVGPFQGPIACLRIKRGHGVCGAAWQQANTIVVPDVHKFPGHIACSAESKSEIVVPVFRDSEVIAVLDIDSTEPGTFDEIDAKCLGAIVTLI
ncbi:MAG: GAF domain-containing protein [Bacteroidaceae bacterium]|nr:GAF domain-containing protein [Bacteroidaceae bacterium]